MGLNSKIKKKASEKSFTLLETVIALGLLVTILLEVANVQGTALKFSDYERKVTQAVWIAKGILANIEYKWKFYDLKDLKVELYEQQVDEKLCPKNGNFGCDYKYNLEIKTWDLPLVDLLLGDMGGGNSEDGDQKSSGGLSGMIKDQLKQTIGEELLKVAKVEVYWPEGSQKNGVDLVYLLTNQQALDQQIELLKPVQSKDKKKKCKAGETLKHGKCVKIPKKVDPKSSKKNPKIKSDGT